MNLIKKMFEKKINNPESKQVIDALNNIERSQIENLGMSTERGSEDWNTLYFYLDHEKENSNNTKPGWPLDWRNKQYACAIFQMVVEGGNYPMFKSLVDDKKMSINHIDKKGNNFAHHQMKLGNTDLLEWFSSNGGDINKLNDEGNSPANEYMMKNHRGLGAKLKSRSIEDYSKARKDWNILIELGYLNKKDLNPDSKLSSIVDRFWSEDAKEDIFNNIRAKSKKDHSVELSRN
jgi:hypothetical protein